MLCVKYVYDGARLCYEYHYLWQLMLNVLLKAKTRALRAVT